MGMQIKSFQKAVTTAGTEVQLTTVKISAKWVRITAVCVTATNKMYIGNDGAAAVSNATGDSILHGQAWVYGGVDSSGHVESVDLSSIWVDSDANGDKVTVSYLPAV